MATHDTQLSIRDEKLQLSGSGTFSIAAAVAGFVGIVGSFLLAGDAGRFFHAYLWNFVFFLSLTIGGLFFVLIQHLTRAGWSVSVRRLPEALASTAPVMGLLAIPILLSVWNGKAELFPWAQPLVALGHGSAHETEAVSTGHGHGSDHAPKTDVAAGHGGADAAKADHAAPHATAAGDHTATSAPGHAAPGSAAAGHATGGDSHKRAKEIGELSAGKLGWLNKGLFTVRLVLFMVFLSVVGWFYWSQSRRQDETGDLQISGRLSALAAPLFLVTFLTMTFLAFDLIMSLDSDFYSTMLGVYYFAGCAGGTLATIILTATFLQSRGYLEHSIHREHYHDLGKLLFGMTFFWGYIAFSQYMLLWYANIPETTYWYANRGATTDPGTLQVHGGWAIVSLLLLFGRLLIPFAGLLSRHVKRNKGALVFWAVWILVFHWIDMMWLVMPEYSRRVTLGLPEFLALIGIGGVFLGTFVRQLSLSPLRPVKDPRLSESLAFQNI